MAKCLPKISPPQSPSSVTDHITIPKRPTASPCPFPLLPSHYRHVSSSGKGTKYQLPPQLPPERPIIRTSHLSLGCLHESYRALCLQLSINRIEGSMICRKPKLAENMVAEAPTMHENEAPRAGLGGQSKALGLVDMRDDASCFFPSAPRHSVKLAGYLH